MSDEPNAKPNSDLTPEQLLAEVKLNSTPDTSFRRVWIMLGVIIVLAITTSVALSIINSKFK